MTKGMARRREILKHPAVSSKVVEEDAEAETALLERIDGWGGFGEQMRMFLAALPWYVNEVAACEAIGAEVKPDKWGKPWSPWLRDMKKASPEFTEAVEKRKYRGSEVAKEMFLDAVGMVAGTLIRQASPEEKDKKLRFKSQELILAIVGMPQNKNVMPLIMGKVEKTVTSNTQINLFRGGERSSLDRPKQGLQPPSGAA
jgi:hypothetical protein